MLLITLLAFLFVAVVLAGAFKILIWVIRKHRRDGFRFSLGYLMAWILLTGLFTTLSFTSGQYLVVQQTPKGEEQFYERYGYPFVSIQTRKRRVTGYYTHRPEIQVGGALGNMLLCALGSVVILMTVKSAREEVRAS